MPLQATAAPHWGIQSNGAAESRLTVRVLIVEDDCGIAALTSRMVQKVGHTAWVASDGLAAVSVAAEVQPDLILLDIQMPGIDGYETARRLRKKHGTKLPIFAVTATQIDGSLARSSGFDGWYTKPLSFDQLSDLVGAALNSSPANATIPNDRRRRRVAAAIRQYANRPGINSTGVGAAAAQAMSA